MIVSKPDRTIQGGKPSNYPSGLSSQDAAERLAKYGPNAVAEEKHHPAFFLKKLWGPVPWMLEITVILETGVRERC